MNIYIYIYEYFSEGSKGQPRKVPVEIRPTAQFVLVSYGLVVGQMQRKGVANGALVLGFGV